jgi:predicted Zn-dependent protease
MLIPMNIRWGARHPYFAILAITISSLAISSAGQTKPAVTPAAAQPAASQTVKPATPPVSYEAEGLVVELSETNYRYEADGTGEKDIHLRVKIQNDAGARQFSVLVLGYASANETLQVESVVAHHADGTTTETPSSDVIDMPAPVTQQAPLYSDLKQLQIPVRGLRAGDTLDYSVRIRRKNPEAPGQFWDNYSFEKKTVVLAEKITLDVPADKYVQVWSPDLKPATSEGSGRRVYTWTSNQLKPTHTDNKKENTPAASTKNKPDVGWTTFHSWQEVGAWYRALAAPRTAPTDALRARADEIAHEAKSPEEQARALYAFVSARIRYVGIDFGIGRYQPHMPAEVLANQYGDCKDKDTLLEALLHAKGIAAAPALIGVNLEMVSELPSPAFFNHVITTVDLKGGRVWLDSTPGVVPFQILLQLLRDKQALVIPASGGAALERTPAETPFPLADRFEATATLTSDGELNGKVNISFRSDNEIAVRLIAQSLAPAQWDQGTQYLANLLGFSGTTSNSTFSRVDDTSQPMQVAYDYTRKPFGDWDNLRIVPLFPVVVLLAAPDKQPADDIELGSLRTESVVNRIKLPEGYTAELPNAVHVKTSFATYDETYKLEKEDLIADRKLVILSTKLAASSWEQYKKFTKDISLGDLQWIQFTAPAKPRVALRVPSPDTNGFNRDASRLISEAGTFMLNRDLESARARLDEAKKLNSEQVTLWSSYATLALMQNQPEQAKENFRHEIAHHPDSVFSVRMYAAFLMNQKETDEALQVLKAYFDHDASDESIDLMLASLQVKTNLTDAIATLRRAADAAPDSHVIQTTLGEYLVRNHQEGEAAEMMKKLLAKGIDDPELLNDAAYVLSLTAGDLPLAEQYSRHSLEILDRQTEDAEIGEANQKSFQRSTLLVASWDTLGYILLKAKKLDEAQDYLEAAWHNQPDADTGLHYGQLEEALGNTKEALRIYDLARHSTSPVSNPEASHDDLDKAIARLKAAHVSSDAGLNATLALQQERTFKVKLKTAPDTHMSAVYRLQLAAIGIQAVQMAGGVGPGDDAVDAIKRAALPHLVPGRSGGLLLRDAVLSCSAGKIECDFVLMPMGGIQAERTQ